MSGREWLKSFWRSKPLWLAILVPLLLSPLPISNPSSEAKAGYCVIVIAFFWVTELIPLPVTSLFPVFLFPMFGIMSASDVGKSFMKDTLMLFIGSLIVAVAVERWNLHKRLALRTLTLVGTQPRWLMFGIMFPCWFLSMWMSNTATCAMMMPIVTAILQQVKETRDKYMRAAAGENTEIALIENTEQSHPEENGAVEIGHASTPEERGGERGGRRGEDGEEEEVVDKEFSRMAKVFIICTAYSANIGGIATLTGTPPNIIFKGLADGLYESNGESNPVNFANWLVIGLPLSMILFFCCWGWMQLYGQGLRCFQCFTKDESFDSAKKVLVAEYNKLGQMSFAELMVLVNFSILALLWVTRNPGFIPGWGSLFEKGFVKDSTPAILISCLLFVLPARPPKWLTWCWKHYPGVEPSRSFEGIPDPVPESSYQPILTWKIVSEKLAWGVILLMGGGFTLADACQVSGLSKWMSGYMEAASGMSPWVTALILSTFIAMATEVTSNSATTTLFVPIVGDLAVTVGVHPLYFMIPCTIATSLAFLLPVATPPNAIVFASGYLKVKDMVLAGIPMNVMSVAVLNVVLNSWGSSLFDLSQIPDFFVDDVNSNSSITTSSSSLGLTTLPPAAITTTTTV